VNLNGLELYGEIVPQVLLDGRILYASFGWNSSTKQVSIIVPYFWNQVGKMGVLVIYLYLSLSFILILKVKDE
jgi:hypothetical protein